MKFFNGDKLIPFDAFSQSYGEEAEVLKNHLELECDFEIQEDLLYLRSPYSNPVRIDAKSKLSYHQNYFYKHSIYKEPLAKAIGLKKGESKPHVIDATAGFLGDSLLMLSMGVEITAFERHPVAAALIINCLKQIDCMLNFKYGCATAMKEQADVIYFDPMYSQKNEKTLPKKEMQIFREVVGVDEDAYAIAEKLKTLTKRLVIKRSVKAAPLLPKPSMSISGKSTSYDVYLM